MSILACKLADLVLLGVHIFDFCFAFDEFDV